MRLMPEGLLTLVRWVRKGSVPADHRWDHSSGYRS